MFFLLYSVLKYKNKNTFLEKHRINSRFVYTFKIQNTVQMQTLIRKFSTNQSVYTFLVAFAENS